MIWLKLSVKSVAPSPKTLEWGSLDSTLPILVLISSLPARKSFLFSISFWSPLIFLDSSLLFDYFWLGSKIWPPASTLHLEYLRISFDSVSKVLSILFSRSEFIWMSWNSSSIQIILGVEWGFISEFARKVERSESFSFAYARRL